MSATLFVIVASLLCCVAALAIFPITSIYMARREAIERDGLARGVHVPAWTLRDSSGRIHSSPPDHGLQLVMFTDHALVSWPSVAKGLRDLSSADALETVVLLDGPNEVAEPALRSLGLESVVILTGSRSLWAQYNVRVAPFAIFADAHGRARASSLVNQDWQLAKLWQIATVPLGPGEVRRKRGPRSWVGRLA